MLADFRGVAEGLTYHLPAIPVVSSVTGEFADSLDLPEYWVRQARQPVRYADAVEFLRRKGVTRFVELGPDHPLFSVVYHLKELPQIPSIESWRRSGGSATTGGASWCLKLAPWKAATNCGRRGRAWRCTT